MSAIDAGNNPEAMLQTGAWVQSTGGAPQSFETSRGNAVIQYVSTDRHVVERVLWTSTAVVILLGVLREVAMKLMSPEMASKLVNLRHFGLDIEHSLPSWYSSSLMLGAVALLWFISRVEPRAGQRREPAWLLLAVIFLLMSIDESVSFHEAFIPLLSGHYHLTGILTFGWVIPAFPVLVLLGLYLLPFLHRLPSPWARRFIIAGLVYVGGAYGLELVGGAIFSREGREAVHYIAVMVTEESMEMIGLTLFVHALLGYIARQLPVAAWRLVRD